MNEIFILLWTAVSLGLTNPVWYEGHDGVLRSPLTPAQHYQVFGSTGELVEKIASLPSDADYKVFVGVRKEVMVTKSFELIDTVPEFKSVDSSCHTSFSIHTWGGPEIEKVRNSTMVLPSVFDELPVKGPIERRNKRVNK